jgi:hypothetical protein
MASEIPIEDIPLQSPEFYLARINAFVELFDEMLASEQWNGRFTDGNRYDDCLIYYPDELPEYWDVHGHAIPVEEMLTSSCCDHCDGLRMSGGYTEPAETSCWHSICRGIETARHVLRMLGINPYDYDIDMTGWW